MRVAWVCTTVLVAMLQAACGGSDADTSAEDAATAEGEAASIDATSSAESSNAPLSAEDIDRWQRAMEGELVAVREAGEARRNARTSDDSVNAALAATDMRTIAAGARAAGLDDERYNFVRATLSSAVNLLVPFTADMDTSRMPAEMLQSVHAENEVSLAEMSTDLPVSVLEALRPRARALREQERALTAERLRVAGM